MLIITTLKNLGFKTGAAFVFTLVFISISFTAKPAQSFPYSTANGQISIWNGTEYIPFFIKGINLGVAVPGTFPGEMAASREEYARWFSQIKDAGFNCIRLYTLHYPRFYEVLDSFNRVNFQNPLLFFQGVWLEEEIPGYQNDLYALSNIFKQEISDNVKCVHGSNTIAERTGKAYGIYQTDVSDWCLGYIIGREIYPAEILTTNKNNASISFYNGNHLSISSASASEAWITSMLDYTIHFEHSTFNTQRPVSNSSWPTLDPIRHFGEPNREEDTVSIDLSKILLTDAPAGFFISYHAYPYYPDFISDQASYQAFTDEYGPNSYLGYLKELKSHYAEFPLLIAEFGVPSSWVTAHYSSSGMNHGGFDELNQGITNIRLLNSIRDAGCAGGIEFAWIDEWFKRTWITDPIDYTPDSRILWHNLASAEQNYGLLAFDKNIKTDTLAKFAASSAISWLASTINFDFFEIDMGLKQPLNIPDELWIAFDTYSDLLGELKLPSGITIPKRSEFALQITNYAAKLYVTQAYDIYGIWHEISLPEQLYHSIPTNGAPWNIVRIKNNSGYSDVQYNGNLLVNYDFQPATSKDGVVISDKSIKIRIPWSYLNVVAPDQMKVLHDYRNTTSREDTVSDGFAISVLYKNQWYQHTGRIKWNTWNSIKDGMVDERLKTSYFYVKDHLSQFNSAAIAVADTFNFSGKTFPVAVDATSGLLKNDFDIDGEMLTSLIYDNPANGFLNLDNDGSFIYEPKQGFKGYDSFYYTVYDGYALSQPNKVLVYVDRSSSAGDFSEKTTNDELQTYPNPAVDQIIVESLHKISFLQLFNNNGQLLQTHRSSENRILVDLTGYSSGTYVIVACINSKMYSDKISISK